MKRYIITIIDRDKHSNGEPYKIFNCFGATALDAELYLIKTVPWKIEIVSTIEEPPLLPSFKKLTIDQKAFLICGLAFTAWTIYWFLIY